MMTLDEAIKHAEEKAEQNYQMVGAYHTDEGVYLEEETKCRMCAEEHEQLAEWLKELRAIKQTNTAEWIIGSYEVKCSNCGYLAWGSELNTYREWKYCPCCGRKIAE